MRHDAARAASLLNDELEGDSLSANRPHGPTHGVPLAVRAEARQQRCKQQKQEVPSKLDHDCEFIVGRMAPAYQLHLKLVTRISALPYSCVIAPHGQRGCFAPAERERDVMASHGLRQPTRGISENSAPRGWIRVRKTTN